MSSKLFFWCIALFHVLHSVNAVQKYNCSSADEWRIGEGYYFKFYYNQTIYPKYNWSQALNFCASLVPGQSSLAIARTQYNLELLLNWFDSKGRIHAYVGAFQNPKSFPEDETEERWFWLDGVEMNFWDYNFDTWCVHEPNNGGNPPIKQMYADSENKVLLYQREGILGFNDWYPTAQVAYVCSIPEQYCNNSNAKCTLGQSSALGACAPCSAGKYGSENTTLPCQDCPIGKYIEVSGNTFCRNCPIHTYSNLPGATACLNCRNFTHNPDTGSTSSSSCQLHVCSENGIYYLNNSEYYIALSSTKCNFWSCTRNCAKLAPGGRMLTLNQEIRKYNLTIRNTIPSFLGFNWVGIRRFKYESNYLWLYSNQTVRNVSWSSRYPLYSGRKCVYFNSSGYLEDFYCNEGLYALCEIPSYNCAPRHCNSGEFFFQGNCQKCSAGKYQNQLDSFDCIVCPAGKYSPSGASECFDCPINTWSHADKQNCTQCPAHSITRERASTSIFACICDDDFYQPTYPLQTECRSCNLIYESCPKNSTKQFIKPNFYKDPISGQISTCSPNACIYTGYNDRTTCAEGHTGFLCGRCLELLYYKNNGECVKCPDDVMKWILFSVFLVIAGYVLLRIGRQGGTFPPDVRIMVGWLQVIGLFPSAFDSWPDTLANFMQIAQLANVDIELASPGMLSISS